jgi:hypothetical protein
MKGRVALGCALLVCLAWMPAQAQILPLYDDFSGDHIDPAKWIATPLCVVNVYDCAREVRHGHLHLAVRGYGATDSESGVTFAESQLLFKDPQVINSIRFRFTVTSVSAGACPPDSPNTEAAHPQLLVHGAFFNAGTTENPEEDVVAYLIVERRTDDPSLPPRSLRVGGFTSKGATFSGSVDLGTVWVGEPVVATLTWDQDHDAFVWHVVKAITTPHVVERTLPYDDGDGASPAEPFKSLRVGTFAPNCAEPGFAAMDVTVDNVRVNP